MSGGIHGAPRREAHGELLLEFGPFGDKGGGVRLVEADGAQDPFGEEAVAPEVQVQPVVGHEAAVLVGRIFFLQDFQAKGAKVDALNPRILGGLQAEFAEIIEHGIQLVGVVEVLAPHGGRAQDGAGAAALAALHELADAGLVLLAGGAAGHVVHADVGEDDVGFVDKHVGVEAREHALEVVGTDAGVDHAQAEVRVEIAQQHAHDGNIAAGVLRDGVTHADDDRTFLRDLGRHHGREHTRRRGKRHDQWKQAF